MNHRLANLLNFFEGGLPSYYKSDEVRITQVQAAVHIAGMLAPGSPLKVILLHAPVGTGKTFAALVPAVYDLKKPNFRLIYSTSSLNLQSQLRNEELKMLFARQEIGEFVIAKGTTHYLCLKRVSEGTLHGDVKKDLLEYGISSTEGDRVSFEQSFYPLNEDIWQMVNLRSQRNCNYCSERPICPTYKHRSKFNDPQYNVIVTNHNQLIQSVINLQEDQSPIINIHNPGGLIVVDEAHDFEEAVLSQLSESLEIRNDLIRAIHQLPKNMQDTAAQELLIIRNEVSHLKRELETSRGRHPLSKESLGALRNLGSMFNQAINLRIARQLSTDFYRRREDDETLLDKCSQFIQKILEPNYTHWYNFEDNSTSITIVTRRFRAKTRALIQTMTANNKLVFMSGTLAVNESFNHLFHSWGGEPVYSDKIILPTVFNYSKQAIAYIPENISEPKSTHSAEFQAYCEELAQEILELIKITQGRTLILSTSHKQMETLYELIKPHLDQMNIVFLKQGERSIELLSEEFKRVETSVLIGTGSFFAGLSIPGKSLISVILCRLPFPPRDDPFLDLIAYGLTPQEKMEDVDFPRMMIKLLQAGGRLIRTITDFGCFSILDPRVFNRWYSANILEELGKIGYRITRDRKEVARFIEGSMQDGTFAEYPPYKQSLIQIPDTLKRSDSEIQGRLSVNSSGSALTEWEKYITPAQRMFYEEVRAKAMLPTQLLKKIKTPFDMVLELVKLNEKRSLGLDIYESFPFVTEKQRLMITKRVNSAIIKSPHVKTYWLSPEELAKYRN